MGRPTSVGGVPQPVSAVVAGAPHAVSLFCVATDSVAARVPAATAVASVRAAISRLSGVFTFDSFL